MPYVKLGGYHQELDHHTFKHIFPPHSRAQYSGIYQCKCGFEIVASVGDDLPDLDDDGLHQAWNCQQPISWQLVAFPIRKHP
jgi:hypothetical protein